MPAESLQLLCQASRKRAVQNLNSDGDKQFANPTSQTIIPLEVGIVTQIVNPVGDSPRFFQPHDWSGWTSLTAGIGNPGEAPSAGTWYLLSGIALTSGTLATGKRYKIVAFVAGDNFTNVGASSNATGVVFTASGTTPTTWSNSSELQEITANLDFDATAAEVQTALNNTAWITADGGVTVTGQILVFLVSWTTTGTNAQMTGFAGNLQPLSIVECGTLVDGTASLQEIQSVEVYQNVASFVELTTDSDPAGITIDELQAGGGGNNQKYRITLDPLPYDGSFTLTIDNGTNPVEESGFINWNSSAEDFVTVLEAMTAVVAGGVEVIEETTSQWLVMFIGALANTAVDVTGDASALQVIPLKLGTLDLDTPGIALLLNGADSVTTYFVIVGIPPGESGEQEILRLVITLNAAVIGSSSTSPQPFVSFFNTTQSDARYLRSNASSVLSAASTLEISSGSTVLWQNGSTLTAFGVSATAATGTGKIVFATSPEFTTTIIPVSNDGCAIGSTTRQFSDLFLAEGAVINFDNGDMTLTQAGNLLTLAGGDFAIPTHTPSSAADTGVMGTLTWDASFVYVATGTNTWKRVAIATW